MPLLPHQPSGRDDHMLGGRLGFRVEGEAIDVDPGRTHEHALLRDALQAQGVAGTAGGGKEQVGLGEYERSMPTRLAIAVGVQQRQRLPDRLHQLETVAVLSSCRLGREPVRELLGVNDVGRSERLLDPEVAVAEHPGAGLAEGAAREQVAQRARRHGTQSLGRGEAVGAGEQVGDLEAMRQLTPRLQLPRSDLMAANDQDTRHDGAG